MSIIAIVITSLLLVTGLWFGFKDEYDKATFYLMLTGLLILIEILKYTELN